MSRTIVIATALCATLALAGVAAAAGAPYQSPYVPTAGPPAVGTPETIDLDAFASGIASRLSGNTVGYSHAIARNLAQALR